MAIRATGTSRFLRERSISLPVAQLRPPARGSVALRFLARGCAFFLLGTLLGLYITSRPSAAARPTPLYVQPAVAAQSPPPRATTQLFQRALPNAVRSEENTGGTTALRHQAARAPHKAG